MRTKNTETVPFANYSQTIPSYVLAENQSSALSFLDYPTKLHLAANKQIAQLSSGIPKLQPFFDLEELISPVISS